MPGLYVVGDLTGVPLLKFSSDSGARAVQTIVADPAFKNRPAEDGTLDLVIVGAGVAGMAAALEARRHGLRFEVLEATEPFSTIVNFPKGKPIFTYPRDMTPAGELQFSERSSVKEGLVEELRGDDGLRDAEARPRGAGGTGRRSPECPPRRGRGAAGPPGRSWGSAARATSGSWASPGEDKDKVSNRLHDPKDYCGQNVLVVGGGDSALEAAIALGTCGAHVTLSYRKPEFSRPKPENVEKLEALRKDPLAEVEARRQRRARSA